MPNFGILPKFSRKTSHMKWHLAEISSSHLRLFDFASLHFFNIFILKESKNFETREYTSVVLPGTYRNLLLIENVLVLEPAYKVIWNYPQEFANIVIHLGCFHMMKENFQVTFHKS